MLPNHGHKPTINQQKLYDKLGETGETVEEVLNQFMREEEGVSVTRTYLFRFAKLLCLYERKTQHALDLHEWIRRQKMIFSTSQHGFRVEIIAKTKGLAAAENYFNNLDHCTKNQSTYRRLLKSYCLGLEEDKAMALYKKLDHLKLVNTYTPFNDMMTLYIGLHQPEKISEVIDKMKQRNISIKLQNRAIALRHRHRL